MKTFFSLFFLATLVFAQSENWVPVYSDEDKSAYINVTGLNAYQEGDIFVWIQEEYSNALQMEEIDEKIYKVKSYYMISRELKRYTLLDVIYYDEDSNVVKSYSYEHKYDKPEFKYSSPILKNTDMEKILAKCLEVIGTPPNLNN
ncbi:MAG: hypothetical protein FD122_3068 [Stygiobacter sp.]|nr:MAG: hypothetical protein FD122_3068 [Stygiobacter sp.]KAF0215724.1 MAG: hypothetical protein FD178_1542 [Ignavibacteria bacterium]